MRLPALPEHPALAPPLWPPLLASRGPGSASAPHAHHGMHLVLARTGALRARLGPRGPWRSAAGVLTAPDALHTIDARGVEVLVVFIDPESEAGAALRPAVAGGLAALDEAQRDALRDAEPPEIMGPAGPAWVARVVALLGGAPAAPRPFHPRVRKLLRLLAAAPARGAVPVDGLAADVGLSPGRLMHAFEGSLGIPIRAYLLWLKLQRAGAAIGAGTPLGQAALEAGFADAAHMTRTFRRMLGITPSELRRAISGR